MGKLLHLDPSKRRQRKPLKKKPDRSSAEVPTYTPREGDDDLALLANAFTVIAEFRGRLAELSFSTSKTTVGTAEHSLEGTPTADLITTLKEATNAEIKAKPSYFEAVCRILQRRADKGLHQRDTSFVAPWEQP